MPHVLIIEDDDVIGMTLESSLRASGFSAERRQNGASGLAAASRVAPDLVLLDLGLPDIDGFTVCRELRMLHPSLVIVLLTARHDQLDIVSGLESGADDYLTKPFSIVVLLARVRAHLRRAAGASPTDLTSIDDHFVLGSLRIHIAARRVLVGGVEVPLRAREFDLLARFAQGVGLAIRREDLMNDVWDSNWFGSTKTLDVHVAALRRQLRVVAERAGPDTLANLPEISTLRGFGYRLDAVSQPEEEN
ncbi:DNA-binding response OmpR family regulator [Cryobacterium sp. CAN_C3]|uniref:response regulator transcription factor n=1 Tax=unclassified Cryobacterium TaxID=2649013 RepID=UPI0018C8F4E3|nr:response regulator transcription factor [Cryobacterium sp. CAN_C3]MEC5155428.1 DNA-binding response OmpR family regulator [Cryobacterium sp. CAN_C3]